MTRPDSSRPEDIANAGKLPLKILSLGAGVQSTAVALLSAWGEHGIDRIDHAVFADTGWEPKAVYKHLEWLTGELERHGIPVHVVSCGRNIREDAINAQVRGGVPKDGKKGGRASMPLYTSGRGTAGQIRRQCTTDYKIVPLDREMRRLGGIGRRRKFPNGPEVEQWFGISLDEIRRMRVSRHKWSTYYYPLVDIGWDRARCKSWLESRGVDAPRSACIGCPYRSKAEWRALKISSPAEFEDAVLVDRTIRESGGMRGKMFLHASRIPLDEVDFSNAEDHGQMNMFRDECAGVCGV